MLKVRGVWPDDRDRREQERHHSLQHEVRRLEGVRHTVLEVLVDVLGEDTRRRSPISRNVSFTFIEEMILK